MTVTTIELIGVDVSAPVEVQHPQPRSPDHATAGLGPTGGCGVERWPEGIAEAPDRIRVAGICWKPAPETRMQLPETPCLLPDG